MRGARKLLCSGILPPEPAMSGTLRSILAAAAVLWRRPGYARDARHSGGPFGSCGQI